ncbi:MAG: HEPN domain-containing protein [Candidatus Omnitrophica bacterium]|nr:HEPN domain-containing protein [Candidatus Omnitrophota bacterium]
MSIENNPSEWLKYARIDLTDSQILFRAGRFKNALYLLEQSCEKLGKSLLLFMGWISTKDENMELKKIRKSIGLYPKKPKNYGHEWYFEFLKDIERVILSLESYISLLEKVKTDKIDLSDDIEKFKSILSNSKEVMNKFKKINEMLSIDDSTINEIIESWKSLLSSILPKMDVISKEILINLKKSKIGEKVILILKFYRHPLDNEIRKFISKLKKIEEEKYLRYYLKISMLILPVCHLSILLSPFFWDRYPDSNLEVDYSENNPFIKNFNKLTELLEICIKCADETKKCFLIKSE